jgi:WD40 repeat protein
LDKVKLKKDAHTLEVTSVRLKYDNDNMLLLSGSKDKYINLFHLTEEFPKNEPVKRIMTGETILQANLFGRGEEYFFDTITKEHSYQVWNSSSLSPIINFKGKNVLFLYL